MARLDPMIRVFGSSSRYKSDLHALEGHDVVPETGKRPPTDVLLWGTSDRIDAAYLRLPEYRDVGRFLADETHNSVFPGCLSNGLRFVVRGR